MTARATLNATISEAHLQREIIERAHDLGWEIAHMEDRAPDAERHDYRRHEKGFVDLVLARAGVVWFCELKTERGSLSVAQRRWREALPDAQYRLIRPRDWIEGVVEELLKGDAA